MEPGPSAEFSSKMCKFLRSLVDFLSALAFLCCHYIFDLYIICLTLSFNTVYVDSSHINFLCGYSLEQWLFQAFKFILSQSKCSLEPTLFRPCWVIQNAPSPSSALLAFAIAMLTDYVYSWNHAYLLSNLVPSWFFRYTS